MNYKTSERELVGEAMVLLSIVFFVFLFGQDTGIISIILPIILVLRFILLYRKGDSLYFVLGFILGGGNDLLSMFRGVYHYTPEAIVNLPIPIWMLLVWGEGFIFLRKLLRHDFFIEKGETQNRLMNQPLILDLAIFAVFRLIIFRYASVAWLPGALYASIFSIRLLIFPPRKYERKLMLTVFLLGPLFEIMLIKAGLYVYQNGVFFGMPLWLIIYWVFISRVIKTGSDWVECNIIEGKESMVSKTLGIALK